MDNEVTEINRKTYDAIAAEYSTAVDDIVSGWVENFEHGLMDIFYSMLNNHKPHILEIGCGNGKDTLYMINKGALVTSTDISDGMLAQAKKRVPNGNFRKMDMRFLDFEKEIFDGAWANGCVYHVAKSDFVNVLKGVHNSLKADGIFSFNFKIGDGEKIEDNPKSFGGMPRFYAYYDKAGMKKILEDSGFDVIGMKNYPNEVLGEKIIHVWAYPKKRL